MAIASSAMNNNNNQDHHHQDSNKQLHNEDDEHEYDVVMPGFRFHPTEEELVEFYLRRKVEGKRFNVELITFLDLYRHDPWELPVYKRAGVEDHPSLPRSLPTRPSSSSSSSSSRASQLLPSKIHTHEPKPANNQTAIEKVQSSTYAKPSHGKINEIISSTAIIPPPISLQDQHDQTLILLQSKQALNSSLAPNCTTIFTNDDLHKLVNINNSIENPSQYNIINDINNNVPNLLSQFSTLQPNITQPPPPPQPAVVAALNVVPAGSFQATPFSDRLWDWNAISEASNKDFTSLFKAGALFLGMEASDTCRVSCRVDKGTLPEMKSLSIIDDSLS
ncbi:hypothetical protein DH2020_024145 [Rehmannia glutinosa]|uniref:NAC domain-containing protein n=1 Tax=Rehmannia glutinosa TaxID=99300 RepID=A0ABR0W8S3_REHGL